MFNRKNAWLTCYFLKAKQCDINCFTITVKDLLFLTPTTSELLLHLFSPVLLAFFLFHALSCCVSWSKRKNCPWASANREVTTQRFRSASWLLCCHTMQNNASEARGFVKSVCLSCCVFREVCNTIVPLVWSGECTIIEPTSLHMLCLMWHDSNRTVCQLQSLHWPAWCGEELRLDLHVPSCWHAWADGRACHTFPRQH